MDDMRRACAIVVLAALLCILVPTDSEGNRKFADNNNNNYYKEEEEISWNLQDLDEDTAEDLWIHCWSQLKERRGFVEGAEDFYPYEGVSRTNGKVNLDKYLYVRRIIQKVISDLSTLEQQFISECLKEEVSPNRRFDQVSGYRNVFSKLQEKVSDWFTSPRRFLRHRKHHHRITSHRLMSPVISVSPVPSPSPSPSPSPGPLVFSPNPAPIPSYQVPASSPSPILLPPSPVLQPPIMAPESYVPDPNDIIPSSSPSPSNLPPPKIVPHRPPSNIAPTRLGNNDEDPQFSGTISMGVVAGLGILALFLFCVVKGRKTKVGPGEDEVNGMRDGKPLLNVSSGDISAGTKNFQSIGNSDSTLQKAGNGSGPNPPSGASGNIDGALPLPPGKSAPPPPGPPPPPPPPAPCPPPPPKLVRPPPNPPKSGNKLRPSPLGPHRQGQNDEADVSGDSNAPKPKLKPFFWEKVPANPDHSMVWHDIKAGSFQFNEEMMESLFGYASTERNNHNKKDSSSQSPPRFIQIIDAKKAQNLAILLKALNVTTEEVCDAIQEGNELPLELIHTLVKMAPTTEEELKLRIFSGDISQLGPAERFLKVMVDIPFAFKRLEALAFMCSFQEEVSSVAESFTTLEVACNELKNNRLFLKLLEAVLKTGNRMNVGTYRGGAQAFKLDTLLKLSDVKGTDGKTTLLHFVIQEIIRSEGLRAARRLKENHSMGSVKTEDLIDDAAQETEEHHRSLGLQAVSTLSAQLEHVRKAALIDGDNLATTVSGLAQSLKKSNEFLKKDMSSIEEENEFCSTLANFLKQAETDITKITEDEKRVMALVKSTGDYFHGNTGRDEGLRPFVIVRDFLIMVDKVCKDVKNSRKLPARSHKKETLSPSSSCESRHDSLPDLHRRLFPAIKQRQMEDSSSSSDDDDSYSP